MTPAHSISRLSDAAETDPTWGVRVCADDFGLSDAVNAGITELVERGRLDAISCMTNGPAFETGAAALLKAAKAAPIPVEIGLHVTLTEIAPLAPMPRTAPRQRLPNVGALLMQAAVGRLEQAEITAEIDRQTARFSDVLARHPDFVDGHQHVHIFPVINAAVRSCIKRWKHPPAWVRSCACPRADLARLPSNRLKAAFLSSLSLRCPTPDGLGRNPAFYGVNAFRGDEDFARLMRRWFLLARKRPDGALIMVHPGMRARAGVQSADAIAQRRPDEFGYLASEAFLADRGRAIDTG